MVRAIVLAAGASSRMGRAKAVLPLGATGDTVLARVIRRPGRRRGDRCHRRRRRPHRRRPVGDAVDRSPHSARRAPRLAAGTTVVADGRPRRGGRPATRSRARDARRRSAGAARHRGRGGPRVAIEPRADHQARRRRSPRPPRDLRSSVFDELRAADPRVGAKAVFAAHRARILDVPVEDEGAFLDLDTPEDYERVHRLPG